MQPSQHSLPDVTREFVTVPETVLPNGTIVPEFKVGKYLTGREGDQLLINATSQPWVRIKFADAQAIAKNAGLALITEHQYLALAHNIVNVAINWTGGAVGQGHLFQGLHASSVEEAQPGNYVSEDANARRWFELSNGERVFDVAGNCFTWVFDNVQGDANGFVAHAFAEDSPSITTAQVPSLEKGVGWGPTFGSDWTGSAVIRGGCWTTDGRAGVLLLNRASHDYVYDYIGFRCTLP